MLSLPAGLKFIHCFPRVGMMEGALDAVTVDLVNGRDQAPTLKDQAGAPLTLHDILNGRRPSSVQPTLISHHQGSDFYETAGLQALFAGAAIIFKKEGESDQTKLPLPVEQTSQKWRLVAVETDIPTEDGEFHDWLCLERKREKKDDLAVTAKCIFLHQAHSGENFRVVMGCDLNSQITVQRIIEYAEPQTRAFLPPFWSAVQYGYRIAYDPSAISNLASQNGWSCAPPDHLIKEVLAAAKRTMRPCNPRVQLFPNHPLIIELPGLPGHIPLSKDFRDIFGIGVSKF